MGAYVAKRREELGLSQGDIINALGYKSRNAVSNIEVGIEGLPAKRIYDWADILEVPRDAFFKFATGEISSLDKGVATGGNAHVARTNGEKELLMAYRSLSPKYQQRLREVAQEYQVLSDK